VARKRRIRTNHGISGKLDEFSCEGEARVSGGRSNRRFSDVIDDLIFDMEGVLKGYKTRGDSKGYNYGISKMEYMVSDTFDINLSRTIVGND
jgi:hypothetical protein